MELTAFNGIQKSSILGGKLRSIARKSWKSYYNLGRHPESYGNSWL